MYCLKKNNIGLYEINVEEIKEQWKKSGFEQQDAF